MNLAHDSFSERGIPIVNVYGAIGISKILEQYPYFKKYVYTTSKGKVRLKAQREALIEYNKLVGRLKYGIELEYEKDNAIIPTFGLRVAMLEYALKPILNRAHERQDSESFKDSNIFTPVIIEIGTGATAIIAILAAKLFNARVYATEIDESYLKIAKRNIYRNNLEDKITLIKSDGGFLYNVVPPGIKADVIITNPPYYPEPLEKEGPWGGRTHELMGQGEAGEYFIINVIKEGMDYLREGGVIAFTIPRKLKRTLVEIEHFLEKNLYDYTILGLRTGNRIRYLFRIYKSLSAI